MQRLSGLILVFGLSVGALASIMAFIMISMIFDLAKIVIALFLFFLTTITLLSVAKYLKVNLADLS